MSHQPPSAPQQGKNRKGGGGRDKAYLHAVTDEQAALLTDTVSFHPLEEVKKRTGANIEFDLKPSPVPGMKIIIIGGASSQIEEAIRLINQKIGSKVTASEQAEAFWVQWVENAFPDLDSRAHFLPPVYFNRVPMIRQLTHGLDVLVLVSAPVNQAATFISTAGFLRRQPSRVYDSDVRDDAAMQRVLCCLNKMCEENREVLVGISQLSFGQYIGESCYAAAAAHLPQPASLPYAFPQNWKQGDFDVLLIHRHHGLVVCEVKAFGDNIQLLNMPQQDIDKNIRKKLKYVIKQLDKAEAMLSHLVSDIAPGLRITKTIAFPNLTACQVQQAVSSDTRLSKDLCRCLGTTTDPVDIAGLCLCSDQLSDPTTPWDVSRDVLRELGNWWQRRVAGGGSDSHMTPGVYKTLVARFCGPATTVTVPCTSPPRLCIKTLGQAVWLTGECYTAQITLFPEQIHLLNMAPPRLFVTGPPGTGKTVVLLLMGIEWLRCGHHVYIVSTCDESRAACSMLYYLLLQTAKTLQSAGVSPRQLHLLQYRLYGDKDVKMVVNVLSQAERGGSLYVITDEVVRDYRNYVHNLCDKLLTRVPRLHLWATSCYHGFAPAGWQVEYLTRPLRSPPAVVREVEQNEFITIHRDVLPYSDRGVPDHTDGPPVKQLYHQGQGHSGDRPADCFTCGREVASFLHSIRVGAADNATTASPNVSSSSGGTTPLCLQWRDMLVLSWLDVRDNSDVVKGLKEADIPVRVMKDDDIEDVATARSDVVWVARGDRVHGLERKVVVCLDDVDHLRSMLYTRSAARLLSMSRCTSQLVIVSLDEQPADHQQHTKTCHLL